MPEESPDPEVDQVAGTRKFDHRKSDRRSGEDRRDAGCCGDDVDAPTNPDSQHRDEPGEPPLLDTASDDVHDGWTRADQQKRRCGDEDQECSRVRQWLILQERISARGDLDESCRWSRAQRQRRMV